jgi:hypothetical protein
MPQVVRTTDDVIINSLYLLGELGTDETPDAFMLKTGLDLLNELIDKFSSDSIYIPFLTTLSFNMQVGKDVYSVSDMITGADINADRIVDLTFGEYIVNGIGPIPGPFSELFTADINTNTISPASGSINYPTGTELVMVAGTGGVLPNPIVSENIYFSIVVDSATIRLATSITNAVAGISIVLTSNGLPPLFSTPAIQVGPFPNQFVPGATNLVYPIKIISKSQYLGVVRQTGLLARPGFMFLDKQATESFITFYPAPDQPYPARIQVKSMIDSLEDQETLGELPPYYYGFLKYALARKFLAYYPSGNWPQQNEDEYQDYYNNLKNANETDLTIRPSVTLTAPEPFYWPNILSY